MATVPIDADEIRRQMAQIRRDLHADVQEVVAGAEAVTDWRRYIRMYPWPAVGVAVAAGYLVVPKRRSVPRDLVRSADMDEVREAIKHVNEAVPEEKKQRKSLVGAAFAMALPLVWRAAQNYAMGYLEQWIAQQQQQFMTAAGPPPPADSPMPGAPRRPAGGPRSS